MAALLSGTAAAQTPEEAGAAQESVSKVGDAIPKASELSSVNSQAADLLAALSAEESAALIAEIEAASPDPSKVFRGETECEYAYKVYAFKYKWFLLPFIKPRWALLSYTGDGVIITHFTTGKKGDPLRIGSSLLTRGTARLMQMGQYYDLKNSVKISGDHFNVHYRLNGKGRRAMKGLILLEEDPGVKLALPELIKQTGAEPPSASAEGE